MITLLDEHFIAKGAYCYCYQHPYDQTKCLKFPTKNKKAGKRLKADISYHRELHKRGIDLTYISNYLGLLESNKGQCHVYECIRDYDGHISKTLASYIEDPYEDNKAIIESLRPLATYLIHNKIMISDMHTNNILIKKYADGSTNPIIVDGIGDKTAITLLNSIPSVSRSKILRRWNRFSDKFLDSKVLL